MTEICESKPVFDKFKTCKGCPDRSAMPNCHMTCEGYLRRCEINEELKKKQRSNAIMHDYIEERKERIYREHHHSYQSKYMRKTSYR